MKKRLFISFSGGETSAFMAQWMMKNKAHEYDEVVCLFANTGQENEETLNFVEKCDNEFGLGVIWIEADINLDDKSKSGFRVVDFDSADRRGDVFERVIQAYGIPNPDWPHCTRELKTRPMTKYLRSIRWESGSYDTAIGIRADEIDRINSKAKENRLIYPLIADVEMTKPRVNSFWQAMPFRLNLKGYEGNCKWCWKKSMRKHLTLAKEHPEWYEFPARMEVLYGYINPEGSHKDRVFFRQHMSADQVVKMSKEKTFSPAEDDSRVYEDQMSLGFDLDASYGCSESCEVNFDEI